MEDDISLVPLAPVGFFQYSVDCHEIAWGETAEVERRLAKAHYRLPKLAALCGDDAFADIYMGWNAEGIAIHAAVKESFQKTVYPEVARGDSFEVMLDTRDVKTSGYNTRFCHHFFAWAMAFEGRQAGEITHFRSEEESHPLCEESALFVKGSCHQGAYTVTLLMPAHCLVGYDPTAFNRLGFTYRVNRVGGLPQHFVATGAEFHIEQQPSLWSSLHLIP